MSFWQYISLRISQWIGARSGNVGAVVLGPPAYSILVENPAPDPPSIGEMANHAALSFGETVFKIFTPIKWILFGISAVLILWMLIGRRR